MISADGTQKRTGTQAEPLLASRSPARFRDLEDIEGGDH